MSLLGIVSTVLSWTTPQKQIKYLLAKKDFREWETFRDSLVHRWLNTNIMCGLIMSAMSTVLFSSATISNAAFALGVISLLSSLIAIGFGVGLMYVLGDVPGSRLHIIGCLHLRPYIFALSVPQIWAVVSFTAFFASVCVFVWEATNKGWLAREWS
ncbi:hypothetical protein M413DRAFT_110740 [Hebeloma cylindrosporum]|uniref:Uncharacterized protein n=1 Tax=Hebeloma cylindrosporum TaxID=76867 RepID=A0A0C2Z8T6_HEBCY|nr:hypothetical protein M413DRAFT_110740 [Hebeloma cylindrosporum h7]